MIADFDSSIASFDQCLSELKVPKEEWLRDPLGAGFDLGFARVEGKWTLAVRTHAGITPLKKASKGVRVSSVNLLAKLRAQVEGLSTRS
jgi:hypothetical protein